MYASLTEKSQDDRIGVMIFGGIPMILFHNDYSEGCHEKVLEALVKTNM